MIFKIEPFKDELAKYAYEEGMEELKRFWGINWIESTPNIILIKNRAEMDEFVGRKTENWMVGSAIASNSVRAVVVFGFENINSESVNHYDEIGYKALIKHEICHLFFGIASKGSGAPTWLKEGVSIYASGQLKTSFWKKPIRFDGFLDANKDNMMKAYGEGGFVVESLVNKFGKEKLIQIIKSLPDLSKHENFLEKFKEIYGFELSYEKINKLYLEN